MSEPLWRTTGARMRRGATGGAGAGRIETFTLENSRLRVTFAPSKGAEIVEFVDKRLDLDFCSYAEHGPLPAVPPGSRAGDDVASFHDGYSGGWQQIFPNGGRPSNYRGAALGQHAEAAGLPWTLELLNDTVESVSVRFSTTLVRLPFRLSRTVTLHAGSARVEFSESATNRSSEALHAMWGQHLTFGRPFLHEGCRITLPPGIDVVPDEGVGFGEVRRGATHAWPHAELANGGSIDLSRVPDDAAPSEMLYLRGFTEGWYEIFSERSGGRVRVRWDAEELPYLWMWREFGESKDYPFWGDTYALGLEPFSSLPTDGLARAVDNGTALAFAGGQTRAFDWTIELSEAVT